MIKESIEEEDLTIYGKADTKYESILGKEFLKAIKGLEVKGSLLGFSIVIWGGHTASYFSYDDEVMSLPFERPFKSDANEKYVDDLMTQLEAYASLLKKEK